MDNSTNITKLLSPVASAALIKAISEVQPPKMDAVNPRFGSSYATLQSHLEALREPFLRNGWAILQHPANSPGAVGVTTMLIHTSGEGLTFEATIPVNPEAFDAQKAGSVYSYLRRYSLAAIGLTTGDRDDDAEVATPTVTHGTGVVKYAQAVVHNSDKVQSHNEQSFKRKSEPSKVPGTWREVVLHFGKNKGTKLGDLPASSGTPRNGSPSRTTARSATPTSSCAEPLTRTSRPSPAPARSNPRRATTSRSEIMC
jgi:hypothetical protein